MQQQVKQDKSETYNYTKSNHPTAPANHFSKKKVHELVVSLNFICLGLDFLNYLNGQVTDCCSKQMGANIYR